MGVMKRPQKLLFKMAPSNGDRSVFTRFDLGNACFECADPHKSLDGDLLSEDWECCLSARFQSGRLLIFAVHK